MNGGSAVVVVCVMTLIILFNIWSAEDNIIRELEKRDEEEPK